MRIFLTCLFLLCISDVMFAQTIVGLEVIVNTFDGSSRRDCQVSIDLAEKPVKAWVALGKVKPGKTTSFMPDSSVVRCGSGAFQNARSQFGAALGVPYVVVDLEVSSDLKITRSVQKLASFLSGAKPMYEKVPALGNYQMTDREEFFLPFFVADAKELELFDIHEAFVRVRPWVLGQKKVEFGKILLTTDVPDLDIHIDGGYVGRSLDKEPALLENILVGEHEIAVSDLSGRRQARKVRVDPDKTQKVAFDLLGLSKKSAHAGRITLGKNPQGYEEYWRIKDGSVVVRVPEGKFLMGSKEGEGETNERPQREVFISGFLIDKNETTWRQFKKFTRATGAQLPPEPLWGPIDEYAVSNILYDEAKAFCEWVGGRLPTEAEWEKAARGTDGRKYPWGNDWEIDRCNGIDGGPHRPKPVAAFPNCLSPYGVINMAGGSWEWCSDWFQDAIDENATRNPKGPSEKTEWRVLKGGGWMNMSFLLRSATRYKSAPDWRNTLYGFRCVQPLKKN